MAQLDDEQRTIINDSSCEEQLGVCPLCGGELKLYQTKKGVMVGCLNYPNCRYIRAYNQQYVQIELVTKKACPLCGGLLAVKSGRFGYFIGCTNFPQCQYIYKDNTEEKVQCPECGANLQVRKTRFNKVFWGCSNYPKCKFTVHFKPIAQSCSKCGYAIMFEKQDKKGRYCYCPNCKTRYYK